jgi:molecular chaperone GrpE
VTKLAKKKEKKPTGEQPVTQEDQVTQETQTPESEAEKPVDEKELLQKQIEELNDKYLRLTAEYQNYRKRVEKEKNDIFKFGTEKLFTDLLPVMDNFERAFNATNIEKADQKIMDGMLMIKKSLEEFFDKHGVKKIEAMGQPFDPSMHHAVLSEEVEDANSEHVVEVFQDGYMMNEKVIRASMVKVSK